IPDEGRPDERRTRTPGQTTGVGGREGEGTLVRADAPEGDECAGGTAARGYGADGGGQVRLTARELAAPVWRTLPWPALRAGGGLGLLLAGVSRWTGGESGGRPALSLLRTAALAYALALTFL